MTQAAEGERRQALAQFLRARRERLVPADVGLPAGGRRRTPGLRREELAQLAGVGATWYTWLEQGRPIRVSASVLDSLARVFQLDAAERAYLYVLAHAEPPAVAAPPAGSSPALQAILDALGSLPAYMIDAHWDLVAWNAAACQVFADYDLLRGRERNLLWSVFTSPAQRTLLAHWELEAQQSIALFRAHTGRYVGEPWHTALVSDLAQASPEFAAWWPRADLQGSHSRPKALNHPQLGRLLLLPTTLQVLGSPTLQLVAYPPADLATQLKLAALAEPAMAHS